MKSLTEKQYYLMQAYVDGETNFLQSVYVKCLVKLNVTAKDAQNEMINFNARIKNSITSEAFDSPDLWTQISQRIDQEEKANIFLGQRDFSVVESGKSAWWLFPSGVLAGGLTAAAITILLSAAPLKSDGASMAARSGAQLETELVSNSKSFDVPNYGVTNVGIKKSAAESPANFDVFVDDLEVDWMRSAGRLRILPNDDRQVAAIIIQRPQRRAAPTGTTGRILQGIAVNNVVR